MRKLYRDINHSAVFTEPAQARHAYSNVYGVCICSGVSEGVALCLKNQSVRRNRCRSVSGSRARKLFADLFRDGMALVEETATYLDGPGRQQSKKLERAAALAYATESMRLTTRLMQLASWLLLHRAVKEGEMSLAQAGKEKTKVKLATTDTYDPNNIELLPVTLRGLIERSQKLYAKVRRLDATIYNQCAAERSEQRQPILSNASLAC